MATVCHPVRTSCSNPAGYDHKKSCTTADPKTGGITKLAATIRIARRLNVRSCCLLLPDFSMFHN